MPSAAALLSALPAASMTTDSAAVPASGGTAAVPFGDLLAHLMASQTPTPAPLPGPSADVSQTPSDKAESEGEPEPALQAESLLASERTPSETLPALPVPNLPQATLVTTHGESPPVPGPQGQPVMATAPQPALSEPEAKAVGASESETPESGLHGLQNPSDTASSKRTPQAEATVSAKAAPEPSAVTPEPAEALRTASAAPAETSRPAFSLQQAPAGTAATPYAPPATVAAQASLASHAAVEQMTQLSVAIQKRLSDGTTKFQLELKPADLGRVDVALTITGNGKVTAHLAFDTPITATTFAARESDLRQQLAAAGLKLDGDALTFTSRQAETQTAPQTQSQSQAQSQQAALAAFTDTQGQHARQNARQAAKALQQADQAATEADLDAALNASMAQLRRPRATRLALDLTV